MRLSSIVMMLFMSYIIFPHSSLLRNGTNCGDLSPNCSRYRCTRPRPGRSSQSPHPSGREQPVPVRGRPCDRPAECAGALRVSAGWCSTALLCKHCHYTHTLSLSLLCVSKHLYQKQLTILQFCNFITVTSKSLLQSSEKRSSCCYPPCCVLR